MSGIAPGPDPSMEDILASIRRILDAEPTADMATPPAPSVGPDEDDELVLDESMLVEDPEASFKALLAAAATAPSIAPAPAIAPVADELPLPRAEVPAPSPMLLDAPLFPTKVTAMPAATPEPERAAPPTPSLLGSAAADVTASSMMSLVRAISADRSTSVFRGGPTIEDLVRDEMRPLLKDWLDTHLPPLVERLVRIEIERVVNRVAP